MSIVDNKKAFFDYFIEERFEAGPVSVNTGVTVTVSTGSTWVVV
jgi:tmRNA-binding protein